MEFLFTIAGGIVLALVVAGLFFYRRGNALARRLETTQQERDQAYVELQQLLAQRDLVTGSIDEGIAFIDTQERMVWMNPIAADIFDSSIRTQVALSDTAWGLEIQPLVREILQHHAEGLEQVVVKDERTFQIQVRAFPNSSQYAAMMLVREVTELQRLGRVRRDFVANISHELRTPVTSVQLLTETLSKELGMQSTFAGELIAKLNQQIDVLRQLAEEMMALALVESGQMPIRLIQVPVVDLAEQALETLRAQIDHKKIQVDCRISNELYALADPDAMRKVFNNLLHNAVKFTPPQGRILLNARRVDDNIEIQMNDTGIGIPARDLPRIFERFYKVKEAYRASDVRGTGLGLAIAKHIVEGHGGKIWAESVEGKGSTFYFTLPAVEPLKPA